MLPKRHCWIETYITTIRPYTASPDVCTSPLLSHGRVSAPQFSLSDRGIPDPPPYPWAGLSSSFPEASEHEEIRENCQLKCKDCLSFNRGGLICKSNHKTYCFDAFMKDRFMDEVEFAKFPDEFNVAKHLDLGNGTLLFLLRSKRVVMFVID